MEITNVRVQKTFQEGKIRALMSVTFDGTLMVHEIKVINRNDGVFVAMPSRREDNGRYLDVVHFNSKDAKDEFSDTVLREYNDYIEKHAQQNQN